MLEKLKKLVAQTSLVLSQHQLEQLVAYVQLLDKWNSAYNLTSVRDPEEMLVKHIMDSLAVSPFVSGERIIDVGTGPGLPGIPLAIALPDKQFYLLDSLGKRIRFLNHVKLQLKLQNFESIQSRVEDHQPETGYDAVLSRAFASMSDMVNWCKHLPAANGQFLAMKGALVQEEIAALPNFVKVVGSHPLQVPTLNAERYLVVLENV
ncbi:16S rRNA (guanine(527)-N(7))-methyltransferase RsmG [Rheinheimera sediminis]|uniref:16S rRNA (guanine(527)-N(7))-methyltransferase RsmG n=1 Tax=Rheinheimera sp. YQF-1 TaxID=2499626 RepID=UPI000FD96F43|nr:16S rRNA (guanine(527)-N(7))-methyltransferase RsmG [Rheinheimera sp. YQF-1]RVT47600.1 16S rRNA (guanine(527)-N(7))-methyltransferase RsmG [Rheinheimera sp. YQF-1]